MAGKGRNGEMEQWNNGTVEKWNNGEVEQGKEKK